MKDQNMYDTHEGGSLCKHGRAITKDCNDCEIDRLERELIAMEKERDSSLERQRQLAAALNDLIHAVNDNIDDYENQRISAENAIKILGDDYTEEPIFNENYERIKS